MSFTDDQQTFIDDQVSSFPLTTVLRQYNNSPNLLNIITLMGEAVRWDDFEGDFFTNIFDITTANTYGLDIWGKILNLSRVMTYTASNVYFGFNEADLSVETSTDPQPFDQYSFYDPDTNYSGAVSLENEAYRKALMMKAMSNITDCTPSNLNASLMFMFSDSGNAWVEHDGPMQMSYHFDFTPTTSDLAIIQSSGILPKPAGCVVSYVFEV